MKKILALLLAMILVFSLAACGADKKDDDDNKDKEKVEDKEKDEKDDEDEDEKEESKKPVKPSKDDEDEEEETKKPSKPSKPADDEDENEDADSFECAGCGEEVSHYYVIEYQGDEYDVCEDCYDEYMAESEPEADSICYGCEDEFDEDDLTEINYYGDFVFVCDDCAGDFEAYLEELGCYWCEETGFDVDELIYAPGWDGYFCEDCYDEYGNSFGEDFDDEEEEDVNGYPSDEEVNKYAYELDGFSDLFEYHFEDDEVVAIYRYVSESAESYDDEAEIEEYFESVAENFECENLGRDFSITMEYDEQDEMFYFTLIVENLDDADTLENFILDDPFELTTITDVEDGMERDEIYEIMTDYGYEYVE